MLLSWTIFETFVNYSTFYIALNPNHWKCWKNGSLISRGYDISRSAWNIRITSRLLLIVTGENGELSIVELLQPLQSIALDRAHIQRTIFQWSRKLQKKLKSITFDDNSALQFEIDEICSWQLSVWALWLWYVNRFMCLLRRNWVALEVIFVRCRRTLNVTEWTLCTETETETKIETARQANI